ncbi:MAG: hypothetical protein Q9192_007298 [Flavoplaca navasiana]
MQKVRDWVASSFKGATMHDRLFPDSRGQLRFQITTMTHQVPIGTASSEASSSSSSGESALADNELEKSGADNIGIALTTTDNDPAKTAASDQLITMLDTLESAKERLGIGYYTIGQATLEDESSALILSLKSMALVEEEGEGWKRRSRERRPR